MLSALLDRLPSITKLPSNNLDFIAVLVSAYPDLQPWSVLEASNSQFCGGFYSKYLQSLMHHEDGNDAAKRDEALVKVNTIIINVHTIVLDITRTSLSAFNSHMQEFCSMLCSFNQDDSYIRESYRRSFFHVASRDDLSSEHYYRDLPFLMDSSVKISEFGLTLSLGEAHTSCS